MIQGLLTNTMTSQIVYSGVATNESDSPMHSDYGNDYRNMSYPIFAQALHSQGHYEPTHAFVDGSEVMYSTELIFPFEQIEEEVADGELHTASPSDEDDKAMSTGTKQSDADVPYATLIYRALMSTPSHRMILQDIYDWFRNHTDKPNGGSAKGWQNSIRHNLSMNEAFVKLEQDPATTNGKKGYVWELHDSAIGQGVESTTRYRKSTTHKRSGRNDAVVSPRGRHSKKVKSGGLRTGTRLTTSRQTHAATPPLQDSPSHDQPTFEAQQAFQGGSATSEVPYANAYGQQSLFRTTAGYDSMIADVELLDESHMWLDPPYQTSGAHDHLLFLEQHSSLRLTSHLLQTCLMLPHQAMDMGCRRTNDFDGCLPVNAEAPLFVDPEPGLIERMLLDNPPCQPGSHHALGCPGFECRV